MKQSSLYSAPLFIAVFSILLPSRLVALDLDPVRVGGIYNDFQGTVTVENDSHITGNLYDDVNNVGTLHLYDTSTIGILDGNPAIPF